MLHTYCEALWGATHMAGCLCPPWKLECLWATSGFSLALVLSLSVSRPTSVSCVPACDQVRSRTLSVWLFLLLLTWEEGRCVCLIEKETDRYTPFSSPAPSPLLPFASWLLLGECLCMYHCLARGREPFSGGGWLSHSYVRTRQMHLHCLTVTHSIFRWGEGILVLCSEVSDTTQWRWDLLLHMWSVRWDSEGFQFIWSFWAVIKVD